MTVNRQWLLAKRPDGMIGPDNFQYTETAVPTPGDQEVLIRNLYFSFDPTQRNWMVDRPSYLPPVGLGRSDARRLHRPGCGVASQRFQRR